MTNELTTCCTRYYRLMQLFIDNNQQFNNLLADALPYTGQTNLSDLDAIISYNRRVQAAKTKADKTFKDLTETGKTILKMMRYFEIPPRKVLRGEIPGELEYEIWANDKDALFINKIKDLPQEPVDPNIIMIKCRIGGEGD